MTLSRPYPERIADLERKLEITRQQYHDADHALRIRDTECRRLRSEASELMAENAGLIQVNDQLKRDKAELHERLDRQGETFGKLLRIGRQQGERIRELQAAVLNLQYQAFGAGRDERIRELEAEVEREKADHARTREVYDAGFGWKGGRPIGQHDLPPTAADERRAANELAQTANEEREG